jgi:hypothetical protein
MFPQACYRLTKPTDLSRLVDNLLQADKINSLRQACEISGCVVIMLLQSLKSTSGPGSGECILIF